MDLKRFSSGWFAPDANPEDLEELIKASQTKTRRRPAQLLTGKFYLCPNEWADRAAAALTSSLELILAFRLYRCWKLKPEGNTTIVCSNLALGIASGNSTKRHSKATMLCKLTRAKLISLEAGGEKQSPRVSVLETL
jgi:hypothetical protein